MNKIFFFIPNLIGYARIILALISLALLPHSAKLAIACYFISCILDAADGYAARVYNQSSQFGAVLDMVTDRCTTASLLIYLAVLYPTYALIFQLLVSLDLASHYMHMVASEKSGLKSHKSVDPSTPYLMKLYYTDRTVLFLVCGGNELFFMLLYCIKQNWGIDTFLHGALVLCGIVMLFKQYMNVIQLASASSRLALRDLDSMKEN